MHNGYTYIKTKENIVSYHLLIDDLIYRDDIDLDSFIETYYVLREKYPDHPYNSLAGNLLNAKKMSSVGSQYVNFSAPDIDGNNIELKSILDDNQVVLLDLWATWCGPCILHTRKMIPVYDKYSDKGFTILGVAGEVKNLDRYKVFMKKEGWVWKNLIELDKQNGIWEKYGVLNSGGGMFLIDKSGEILAVNPDAEEVEEILKEKLNS